ncbi:SOS response-associated peptidase [Bacillus alkalicellulosilyticus]|uniref:SOS response-associated peptidase n=1 Tax=Alkalihalobacterium alkalicellulosilyticum TaxID=1912214 RepID=UPI0009980FE5|nr:SOS response-associated peptidase [Bacillus alkalicellulosilyticus]
MCGRFTLHADEQELIQTFQLRNEITVPRSYNIAPGQPIFAVIQQGQERRGGLLQWGLIPSWAKDRKNAYKMINARGETIAEKPSFKKAFAKRRCLLPTTGFYEWKQTADGKKPYFIRMADEQLFAFAGLWEKWIDPESQETVFSCTIVTTFPNELMSSLHNRMPLLLSKEGQQDWLNPELTDVEELEKWIQPYPSEEMVAYEVSTFVNKPSNNDHSCIAPL